MVLLQLSCPSTITAHPYGFLGAAVCSTPLWEPAQASLEATEMFSPQSILHQGVPSTPCRALSCSLLDAPNSLAGGSSSHSPCAPSSHVVHHHSRFSVLFPG